MSLRHGLAAFLLIISVVGVDLMADEDATDGAQVDGVADETDPVADPAAMVRTGHARFTILTDALIRLEWSDNGRFEDRASLAFINRRLPVPRFTSRRDGDTTIIETDRLTLRYTGDARFAPENLRVTLKLNGNRVAWKPGTPDTGNLGGTTRTLDGVSGSCPIDEGLLSRDGWTIVDDSQRLLFADDGWTTPRTDPDAIDWYFFGYGHDYKRQLRDFTTIGGRIPLPPRFVFGAWWSRYWDYTDGELRALVNQFADHDVPLDVLVIDMGWHLPGWTGYTWNPKFFPDPKGFLRWTRDRELRTTLNLHPHDGVGQHESAFADVARHMGLDPKTTDRIPFDCGDRKYMQAYFKFLHHPKERAGIDFWWTDWQQGEQSAIPGLDPLFWLNHLHWADMTTSDHRKGLRPLIFSRWGGLGNHRYQVGFSGDTFCNWPSLAFQPFFTSTAGNVGYAYWSHDIGGHQPGPVDPELYTRWVQFGALSPVLRTHTTTNPAAERRIWAFDKPYFDAMRDAFRLRYSLIPYIYTMARKCHDTGLPLCRPMYYEWPELDEAYERPNQYMFGDDLLVAPVIKPGSAITGMSEVDVWLPPGQWIHWFTGAIFEGSRQIKLPVALDEIPLFARAGSVIPTTYPRQRSDRQANGPLIINVFPGCGGEFVLYEDDGISTVDDAHSAKTRVTRAQNGEICVVTVHPTIGAFTGMDSSRDVEVRLRGFSPADPDSGIQFNGKPVKQGSDKPADPGAATWWFDREESTCVVTAPKLARGEIAVFSFDLGYPCESNPWSAAGARGRLRDIRAVEDQLNLPHAAVSTIGSAAHFDQRVARETDRAWDRALDAALSSEVNSSRRAKAMARLLGLAASMEAAPADEIKGESGDGGIELRFAASLGASAAGSSLTRGPWSATVQLDDIPNWRIAAPTPWTLSSDDGAGELRGRGLITPIAGVQSTRITGMIDIKIAGGKINVRLPIAFDLLPSINRWWIVGPFDAPRADRLARRFAPEDSFDLDATYTGQGGKPIRWREYSRKITPQSDLTDEFFVEFHKVFSKLPENAVAYAVTFLHAPHDMDAVLAIGSDDGFAAWLNGVEVHRHDVGRPYMPKQDRAPVHLKKGVNRLMLKISQGNGMWGFGVHVENENGVALSQVTAQLSPSP